MEQPYLIRFQKLSKIGSWMGDCKGKDCRRKQQQTTSASLMPLKPVVGVAINQMQLDATLHACLIKLVDY